MESKKSNLSYEINLYANKVKSFARKWFTFIPKSTITLSCSTCIKVAITSCPDQIGVNGGLDPNTEYRWEILDKFGYIYNGLVMTDATGAFGITVLNNPDIPLGLFQSFSGVFILKAYKYLSAYELENTQFMVNEASYDCVELRFIDYQPSLSFFNPDDPLIYVLPTFSPVEVPFVNQTEVVVVHGLGFRPFVQIFDNLDPPAVIEGQVVHDSNIQFTVTFDVEQSGIISYR